MNRTPERFVATKKDINRARTTSVLRSNMVQIMNKMLERGGRRDLV